MLMPFLREEEIEEGTVLLVVVRSRCPKSEEIKRVAADLSTRHRMVKFFIVEADLFRVFLNRFDVFGGCPSLLLFCDGHLIWNRHDIDGAIIRAAVAAALMGDVDLLKRL